jgi:hypothetical protein
MNDQTTNSEPKSNKVFDIMPPGRTAPSPTSRPVIITSRPAQVEDTTLTKAVPVSGISEASDVKADTQSIAVDSEPEVLTETSVTKPVLANPWTVEEEQSEEGGTTSGNGEEQEPLSKTSNEEESENGSEPAGVEQAKTLSDKQIIVAHHSKPVAVKRNVILLAILLIIVVVAAIDLMLDAQILKSSLPHTHFLKQ